MFVSVQAINYDHYFRAATISKIAIAKQYTNNVWQN